jgi:ketosteroid isomerase-like protein
MGDETVTNAALGRRFFDLIEAGDLAGVAACYADDAVIWHNTDGIAQGKADNLETLKRFTGAFSGIRYTDRRLVAFDTGFAHQHLLAARRRDGAEVQLAAAIVCEVKDGKITRLDEYFDSAQLAPWLAR